MERQLSTLWQRALERLSDVVNGRAADMGGLLVQLSHVPPQPAAAWRGILQDMQVRGC